MPKKSTRALETHLLFRHERRSHAASDVDWLVPFVSRSNGISGRTENWKKRLALPSAELWFVRVFRVLRSSDLCVGGTGLMTKDFQVARGQPFDRNLLGLYEQYHPKW